MAKKPEAKVIEVHRRTLSIGPDYQVYQLNNVARVQVLDWKPDLGYGSLSSVLGKLLVTLVAAGVATILANSSDSTSGDVTTVINWAALVLLIRYAYQAIRIVARQTQWALVLETTGLPIAVITGKHREPVVELHRFIVNSIENPPERAQSWHIGHLNMVGGDQINQSGEGNKLGKVLNG
ncbi:hypothetical protein AGRA3207_005871 [Actinomadura graeca]|uniref:Uncharacterized protein n=1 Tax=Actinomadura graeca TaxID=2750812 RepID=A0ABX8R3I9_9ACTN|nr:DUF6232 family protein [Actinomadura graeca]QXJ24532.1 hypothetical protein AGRA3207_005871 [Actinomadura graeca]